MNKGKQTKFPLVCPSVVKQNQGLPLSNLPVKGQSSCQRRNNHNSEGVFTLAKFMFYLLIVFLMVALFITTTSSYQGTSVSYTMDIKQDSVAVSETQATSTTLTQRVVGGIQAVGEYVSSLFSGRFGVLGEGDISKNITACDTLDIANTIYMLNESVNSSGTCFTIGAENVTLDCQNNIINYSQTANGYAVTSNLYNDTTVRNCDIEMGSTTRTNSYALYFRNGVNSTFKNNTIDTVGDPNNNRRRNYGVYLRDYTGSVIEGNNITTTGNQSYGIYLFSQSNSTNITGNVIQTQAGGAIAIGVSQSSEGIIDNNNITTLQISSIGVYLYQSGKTNVTNNEIITQQTNSYGVYVRGPDADLNEINNNNITTYGSSATNVYLYMDILNSKIGSNTIKHYGVGGYGLYLYKNINNSLVDSNIISAYGSNSRGLVVNLYSNYNNFTNNNITANGTRGYGVYFTTSKNTENLDNFLINNTVYSTSTALTLTRVNNANIFNNIFNSTSSRIVSATNDKNYPNRLNTTKTAKANIIGGNNIGGNFWANYLTNGFSQTCLDDDLDGICDNEYKINKYNLDYLALTAADNVDPYVGIVSPENATFVNGRVAIYAEAYDSGVLENVVYQYSNSSVSWTNIPNCNFTSAWRARLNMYRCYWYTQDFSDDAEGYDIRAVAYDGYGNTNTSLVHYTIDRTMPIILDMDLTYPDGQSSVRNEQNVTLITTVTDSPYVAAGIDYAEAELTNLNNTNLYSEMVFVAGSLLPLQNSTWHLNVTIDSSTGLQYSRIRVYDAAIPSYNRRNADRWYVNVDNNAPTYFGLDSTSGVYNNTIATFVAFMNDNFDLSHYIFSQNWSGSWVNDSIISVGGASNYTEHEHTVYEGNFSYKFFIFDDAGNMNETLMSEIEVLGPELIPTIHLVGPSDGTIANVQATTFQYYYVTETVNNCTLVLDDILNQTTATPAIDTVLSFSKGLEEGEHSWFVSCEKNETFGEEDIVNEYFSDEYNIKVDLTAPIITIDYPLNVTYNNTRVSFNVTIDEDADWCGYSLDSAVNVSMNEANSSRFYYNPDLTAVGHSVVVSCNDTANNYNSNSVSFSIAPEISISLVNPTNSTIITRGDDGTTNEDDLSVVAENTTISARLYNRLTSDGINSETCHFYFNGTYIGDSTTDSSGYCNISYDKSTYAVDYYNVSVNYTYAAGGYSGIANNSLANVSLVSYSFPNYITNFTVDGGLNKFFDGDVAKFHINVTKTNASGTFFFNPGNISINATDSSGVYYPDTSYVTGYRLNNTAVGMYEVWVTVNKTFGTAFIRWETYISANNYTNYLGSALHTDVEIIDYPYCGDGSCDIGESCSSCSTDCGACGDGGAGEDEGGTTPPCVPSWGGWSGWSECVDGEMTRLRSNGCGSTETEIMPCGVEICDNSIDDNSNGDIDCSDADCLGHSACCTPDWTCSWTGCEGGESGDYSSSPYGCIDLNDCGSNLGKPEDIACVLNEETDQFIISPEEILDDGCLPVWDCEGWNDCSANYNLNDVLSGEPTLDGMQFRKCNDLKDCRVDIVERRNCNLNVLVRTERTEWCFENYVEIYEIKTDNLLTRVKESSLEGVKSLDIGFVVTDFLGYCDYCYNSIMDFDEEGVDCGGAGCPGCVERREYIDYFVPVKISLWFILGFLIFFLVIKNKDEVKEKLSERKRRRIRMPRVSFGDRLRALVSWIRMPKLDIRIKVGEGKRVAKPVKRPRRRLFGEWFKKRRERVVVPKPVAKPRPPIPLADLRRQLGEWKKESYHGVSGLESGLKARLEMMKKRREYKRRIKAENKRQKYIERERRKASKIREKNRIKQDRLRIKEQKRLRGIRSRNNIRRTFKNLFAGFKIRSEKRKQEKHEKKVKKARWRLIKVREKAMKKEQKRKKKRGIIKSIFVGFAKRSEKRKLKKTEKKIFKKKAKVERKQKKIQIRLFKKKEKVERKIFKKKEKVERKQKKKIFKKEKKAVKHEVRILKKRIKKKKVSREESGDLRRKLNEWKKKGYYNTTRLNKKLDRYEKR